MAAFLPLRLRSAIVLTPVLLGTACVMWACSGSNDTATENTQGGSGHAPSGGSGGGAGSKAQGGESGDSGQGGAGDEGAAGDDGEGDAGAGGSEDGEGGAAGDDGESGAAGEDGEGGAAGDDGEGGAAGGAGAGTAGKGGSAGKPATDAYQVKMTFMSANIGRDYGNNTKAMTGALDAIGDFLDKRTGPRFIGWQEISESDPCGASCEFNAIVARFKDTSGWSTRRPKSVKEPITSKGGGGGVTARATFASAGWEGVSPTRYITVVHYPALNLSYVNTHFIAGAWTPGWKDQAKRRDYWKKAWKVFQSEVAKEHDKGYNVIATGDLNRPRATSSTNPKWDPTTLHAGTTVVGGVSLDYIFAVPAAKYKYVKAGNGAVSLNAIQKDHDAYWATGSFQLE